MGAPCRLAPTAEVMSTGKWGKSKQVLPVITSITSVLLEKDLGYPLAIMTMDTVEKKIIDFFLIYIQKVKMVKSP